MPKPLALCAAICTYNRYDLLQLAVESLVRQKNVSGRLAILIVDNSPDEAGALREMGRYKRVSNLRYVYESRPGLSNARNVAARETDAEVVAYLDDDAIASEGWAAALLDAYDQFPQAGIVGGPVLPMWEEPRPVWLTDKLTPYVSVVDWGGASPRVAAPGEWFAGANISFRRKLVLDAEGFDTSLGRIGSGASLLSNEEIKLSEKIHAMGHHSVYAPAATVDHLVEKARLRQSWFRRRVVWQAISDYLASGGRDLTEQQAGWDWVLTFLSQCKPSDRSFRGLFVETESGKDFEDQLAALYNFAFNMLAGFPVGQ
jgi:glycosyltransferase involved in cell wall biosynthesis